MKIAIAGLNAHAIQHEDRLGLVLDADEPNVTYYISSCTPAVASFLRQHGLFVEGDHVHYDPFQRGPIETLARTIIDEYDSGAGETWKAYHLQGDDDVDYNGGYILIFLDLLQDFLGDVWNKLGDKS